MDPSYTLPAPDGYSNAYVTQPQPQQPVGNTDSGLGDAATSFTMSLQETPSNPSYLSASSTNYLAAYAATPNGSSQSHDLTSVSGRPGHQIDSLQLLSESVAQQQSVGNNPNNNSDSSLTSITATNSVVESHNDGGKNLLQSLAFDSASPQAPHQQEHQSHQEQQQQQQPQQQQQLPQIHEQPTPVHFEGQPASMSSSSSNANLDTPPNEFVMDGNMDNGNEIFDEYTSGGESIPFTASVQKCHIWNSDKSKSYSIEMKPKIDRGFFIAEGNWTCYRRNYFQLSSTFNITENGAQRTAEIGGAGPLFPNIPKPESSTNGNGEIPIAPTPSSSTSIFAPAPVYHLELNNQLVPIKSFLTHISAHTNGTKTTPVELVQHTSKRDKGPLTQPVPRDSEPGALKTVFERIQFRTATSNNGRKKPTAAVAAAAAATGSPTSGAAAGLSQQFFIVSVEVLCRVASGEFYRLCESEMERGVVVRGRAPGHYMSRDGILRDNDGPKRKQEDEEPVVVNPVTGRAVRKAAMKPAIVERDVSPLPSKDVDDDRFVKVRTGGAGGGSGGGGGGQSGPPTSSSQGNPYLQGGPYGGNSYPYPYGQQQQQQQQRQQQPHQQQQQQQQQRMGAAFPGYGNNPQFQQRPPGQPQQQSFGQYQSPQGQPRQPMPSAPNNGGLYRDFNGFPSSSASGLPGYPPATGNSQNQQNNNSAMYSNFMGVVAPQGSGGHGQSMGGLGQAYGGGATLGYPAQGNMGQPPNLGGLGGGQSMGGQSHSHDPSPRLQYQQYGRASPMAPQQQQPQQQQQQYAGYPSVSSGYSTALGAQHSLLQQPPSQSGYNTTGYQNLSQQTLQQPPQQQRPPPPRESSFNSLVPPYQQTHQQQQQPAYPSSLSSYPTQQQSVTPYPQTQPSADLGLSGVGSTFPPLPTPQQAIPSLQTQQQPTYTSTSATPASYPGISGNNPYASSSGAATSYTSYQPPSASQQQLQMPPYQQSRPLPGGPPAPQQQQQQQYNSTSVYGSHPQQQGYPPLQQQQPYQQQQQQQYPPGQQPKRPRGDSADSEESEYVDDGGSDEDNGGGRNKRRG